MAITGVKNFQAGAILTAADLNTYNRGVFVFASAAARTSAFSSAGITLTEGWMSYLVDTNSTEVYNGSAWVSVVPTTEIAYGQRTSDVNVTATSAAAATDLGITTGAATYDGTAVVLQFSAAAVDRGTSSINIALYDGASLVVDRLCQMNSAGAQALNGFYRFTPSAGSHTYLVKGWVDAGTGTVYAGSTRVPAFCRVTRA